MATHLYMAWRAPDDDAILWSTFDGNAWASAQLTGAFSSFGPALAVFGRTLYLAWQGARFLGWVQNPRSGVPGGGSPPGQSPVVAAVEPDIYLSHFNAHEPLVWPFMPWINTMDVVQNADRPPHLAISNDHLYLAHKVAIDFERGIESKNISLFKFDGTNWSPAGGDAVPPFNTHVGTSNGPAIAVYQSISDPHPLVYMVWRGADTDQSLWWASFDGNTWTDQTGQTIPGEGTSTDPALEVFRGELYLVWNGGAGDSNIYWTKFDGQNQRWVPRNTLPGGGVVPGVGTNDPPALAVFQDRLYMTWKGVGDENIWWSWFDGAKWTPQQVSDDNFRTSNGPPAIVAYDPVIPPKPFPVPKTIPYEHSHFFPLWGTQAQAPSQGATIYASILHLPLVVAPPRSVPLPSPPRPDVQAAMPPQRPRRKWPRWRR